MKKYSSSQQIRPVRPNLNALHKNRMNVFGWILGVSQQLEDQQSPEHALQLLWGLLLTFKFN